MTAMTAPNKEMKAMAQGDVNITVIGNLTADPELRYTPNGAAVANFTVASTPRQFDRQTNEWKDGETLFMRCSVWREQAEYLAESVQRGSRVIVTGRLKSRSYETKEGEKRTTTELEVDEVGPSLRYATAKVAKQTGKGGNGAPQGQGGGFGGNQGQNQGNGGGVGGSPHDDPWATGGNTATSGQQGGGPQSAGGGFGGNQSQGQQSQGGGWSTGTSYDEPPF